MRDFLTCVIELFGIAALGVVAVFLARHCEMKKISQLPKSEDGPEGENLNHDDKSGDSHGEEVSEEESSDEMDNDNEGSFAYATQAKKLNKDEPAVELNDALMA